MKKTNEDQVVKSESEKKTLEVFCSDSIGVKARMTFDSCKVKGVQIIYWQDDDENIEERIDAMFGILFTEMDETKKLGQSLGN